MINDNLINNIISDIYYTSYLIDQRIDRILLKTFPTTTAIYLLQAQKKICKFSRGVLLALAEYSHIAPGPTYTQLKFIHQFLHCELAAHIRFAEGASIDKTPASFVKSLEKMAEIYNLLDGAVFIIRPQWHYNFKIFELREYYEYILGTFLEDYQVDEIFNEFSDKKLYIISFPGFQRSNLQIQTTIGHELGHPIASKYLTSESNDYQYEIEKEVENQFSTDWGQLSSIRRDEEKSKIIEKVTKLRNGFLEEIIADLISLYLFNLCSLLETEAYIRSSSDIDKPDLNEDNPHPAWRTRLRIILKEISKGDLNVLKNDKINDHKVFTVIKTKLNFYTILAENKEDINKLKSDRVTTIVNEQITQSLPNAISWLNQNYNKIIFKFDNKYEQIIQCVERLKAGLPPNATDEKYIYSPIIQNVQNILISGRLYKETYLEDVTSKNSIDFINNLENLNQLMLKGLELSRVHEEFHCYNMEHDKNYRERRLIFRRFKDNVSTY